jgi:hypothetical protein
VLSFYLSLLPVSCPPDLQHEVETASWGLARIAGSVCPPLIVDVVALPVPRIPCAVYVVPV